MNQRLRSPSDCPPDTSWWMFPKTREAFDREAANQLERMANTTIAGGTRSTADGYAWHRPRDKGVKV